MTQSFELVGGPFDGERCTVPLGPYEVLGAGCVIRIRGQVYQLSSVPSVNLAHHIGTVEDLDGAKQ